MKKKVLSTILAGVLLPHSQDAEAARRRAQTPVQQQRKRRP